MNTVFPPLTFARVLLSGACFFLANPAHTEGAEPYAFAPLPMETPETVASQWKPALDYLGKALGTPLHIEYAESYATILEKFKAGKLDLAYLGPLPYVTLKKHFPAAVPVVHFNEKNGQPHYTCAIVALAQPLPAWACPSSAALPG